MSKAIKAAFMGVLLGACSQPALQQHADEPRQIAPLFAGKWAYEPSLCAEGAWDFEESGVNTAGEVSCSFQQVRNVSETAYEIDASCSSEGATQTYSIALDVNQSAQSINVSGGPWSAPITLKRCLESNTP